MLGIYVNNFNVLRQTISSNYSCIFKRQKQQQLRQLPQFNMKEQKEHLERCSL